MNILYMLISISLSMGLLFLGLFIWAFKKGQFEDTEAPSYRILFDKK